MTIIVDYDHPVWRTWDDDDWGGATANQWLGTLVDEIVVLRPGQWVSDEVVVGVRNAVGRVAAGVYVCVVKMPTPT